MSDAETLGFVTDSVKEIHVKNHVLKNASLISSGSTCFVYKYLTEDMKGRFLYG